MEPCAEVAHDFGVPEPKGFWSDFVGTKHLYVRTTLTAQSVCNSAYNTDVFKSQPQGYFELEIPKQSHCKPLSCWDNAFFPV